MSDLTPQRLSKENTPCLDENRIDEDNGGDNSKEIELSDISDEEDNQWPDEDARNGNGNSNGDQFGFKRLTRNNRDRNYRENLKRRSDRRDITSRLGAKRMDNSRRKEIERYNVRKVIANRDFSISRSRSRTGSPPRHRRSSYSPRRRSISPKTSRNKSHYYSPISPRHSPSPSPDRNYPRNYQSPQEKTSSRRSRSRHKHKSDPKRKKHRSKEHQRKHSSKKSRSRSKRHSTSLSPISPSRQIVANPNLTAQEKIKVILKNDDAYAKRQKIKKRDKKSKKEKSLRKLEAVKEKTQKELQQTKEVFASGDNILISVCFNNNNNNNTSSINPSSNNHTSSNGGGEKTKEVVVEEKVPKVKSKKRTASPASSISSLDSFEQQRRQRKHKRKKTRSKKDQRGASKEPKTPPLNPPTIITTVVKRKNDSKPVAIIDLEKSPGKEITQSPKEVIILSDSDGEGKKRDKDIIIVEDITIEKGGNIRNHSPRDHLSPKHVTPESPPPIAIQPVLKFALKSKSNILPFNLLHDQADEIEELPQGGTSTVNTANNLPATNVESKNLQKEQETVNEIEKNASNQNEAYDPFEPTKSRSTSPVTPPHPHPNDIASDTLKSKVDLFNEKKVDQIPCLDEHIMWTRKEYESKKSQPVTPPLPPSFMFSSGSNSKQVTSNLYDGIYGNDLKTPVIASPAKPNLKSSKDIDDDDRTPYSPSSDGYDYEPAPPSGSGMHTSKSAFDNIKHSDIDTTQSSEPSGSFSFDADNTTSKTPLKLTASTLKTFNSTMTRSTGPVGLQYVNKAELSIFENYMPQQQKSPLVKRQTTANTSSSSFIRSKMSRFLNNENGSPHRLNYGSTSEALKPPVIDESMLDDEVPSSAVDLVNKDRFLKKSLRIERVAEEVKLVLKPHYNKKHITKEEYKEILRKSVPKICHNKTGEINVQKITQLIEAYIKKFRYKRKSGIASSI